MKYVSTIFKNWISNDNTSRAAAIAFYALFSFSPLLILTFNFSSIFIDKAIAKEEIIYQLSSLISPDTVSLIQSIFLNNSFKWGSSILSLFILFFASSKIFSVIRSSFNIIFSHKDNSRKEKILSFIEGQIISFILVPITCLFFFGSLFINLIISNSDIFFFNLISENYLLINIINYSISFLILVIVSYLLIKFLPAKYIPAYPALLGAIVSAIFFELGRFLITEYLSLSFIKGFYGSMGSLVVLMLWVYYTVQILLLGAEVTSYTISLNSPDE